MTWYRNDRRLMEAERIALVRDGNFWCADVSAVSVEDAGRWTCTAENIGGRASCSAHLNVLGEGILKEISSNYDIHNTSLKLLELF